MEGSDVSALKVDDDGVRNGGAGGCDGVYNNYQLMLNHTVRACVKTEICL